MQLPKRKPTRLKDYDYSQNGAYFITICTAKRKPLLCEIVGADIGRPNVNLTEYGEIVKTAIDELPLHYKMVVIDKYVIMPNHLHLIMHIENR